VTGGNRFVARRTMGPQRRRPTRPSQLGYGDVVAVTACVGNGRTDRHRQCRGGRVGRHRALARTLAVMNVISGLELVLTTKYGYCPRSTRFILLSQPIACIPVLAYISSVHGAHCSDRPIHAPRLRLMRSVNFQKQPMLSAFRSTGCCRCVHRRWRLRRNCRVLSVSYLSGSTTGSGEMLLRS